MRPSNRRRERAARLAAIGIALAVLITAASGCRDDGGDEEQSVEPLVIVAGDLSLEPAVVADTLRPVTVGELAGSGSDVDQRREDLKTWGFKAGATACLARPTDCARSQTLAATDALVIDIVLVKFSRDGADDAYTALAADVARRLSNLTAQTGATFEELPDLQAGEASEGYRQTYAEGAVQATSEQLVFRQGEYVVVMSTLMQADAYDEAVMRAAASAQAAKLTGNTSDD